MKNGEQLICMMFGLLCGMCAFSISYYLLGLLFKSELFQNLIIKIIEKEIEM